MGHHPRRTDDQPHDFSRAEASLTRRQLQVLALVAEGATDGEIALKLEISPGTVAWHVKAIRTRLDARSRTHAVALALRQGLLLGRRSRDQPT